MQTQRQDASGQRLFGSEARGSPHTTATLKLEMGAEGVERGAVTTAGVGAVAGAETAAPEGGWSWLVVGATALSKMAFWGTLPCFGMVFADVIGSLPGSEGASISSIISIFTVCLDLAGLSCLTLYRVLSYRQVAVLGGIVFFMGSLSASFSVSVTQLIITYGAIQGIGFGMMISANLASFNQHFRRRRTMAMAVAQCANSGGCLALPLATQALQAAAGARAAKLALAAVGALAAASQLLIHAPPGPRPNPLPSEQEHSRRLLVLPDVQKTPRNITHEGILLKSNRTKRRGVGEGVRGACARAWRLTGLRGEALREPQLLLVAAGVSLVHVAEPSFFAMLPLHLRALGLREDGVATAVAVANAGDFAGRLALVLAGPWLGRSNRLVFAGGALASAAALFALSFMTSWETVLTLGALLGVCKGIIYVTFFLTLAEIVLPEHFPSACALQFVMQIAFSMSVSPMLGVIRDATGSFPACFRVVALLLVACPFAWGLQAALLRHTRRQRSAATSFIST